MRFVDWDTGQTFFGKLMACPEKGIVQVLKLFREGGGEEEIIVERQSTGSIAILEASGEDLLSLRHAGYQLSID